MFSIKLNCYCYCKFLRVRRSGIYFLCSNVCCRCLLVCSIENVIRCIVYLKLKVMHFLIFMDTSNVPARGVGTLFAGAQRPARDARRINAEGDDDGKNHRYAENHFFC